MQYRILQIAQNTRESNKAIKDISAPRAVNTPVNTAASQIVAAPAMVAKHPIARHNTVVKQKKCPDASKLICGST